MDYKYSSKSSKHINRREFIKISSTAAICLTGGSLRCDKKISVLNKIKPNILVIITDQQHIDTLSANGCPYIYTPALDYLKKRGTSYELSYTTNPVCSPARSSIFTGRASSETGVYVNNRPIRSVIPNLGQWFSQLAYYETVYAGKWHLPETYTNFIPGFRVLNTGIMGQGNLCDSSVSRACEGYLRNHSNKIPFFMVASFMQPHDICEWLRINTYVFEDSHYKEFADQLPVLPKNFDFDINEPDKIINTRQSREPVKGKWTARHWQYYIWSYYRHVEMVDSEIGRLLYALEQTGFIKNTLILFMSDHGEGLAHHQMVRKNTLYDEAVKVPLIISWPDCISENKTDTVHLVSGLDIVPTLCDYAGIEPPEKSRGRSLHPILEGKSVDWRHFIVSEVSSNRGRMVRTKDYKYIVYKDDPVEQLFDMKNDPDETRNLSTRPEYENKLAEHRKLLREWEQVLEIAPDLPNRQAWWYEQG